MAVKSIIRLYNIPIFRGKHFGANVFTDCEFALPELVKYNGMTVTFDKETIQINDNEQPSHIVYKEYIVKVPSFLTKVEDEYAEYTWGVLDDLHYCY